VYWALVQVPIRSRGLSEGSSGEEPEGKIFFPPHRQQVVGSKLELKLPGTTPLQYLEVVVQTLSVSTSKSRIVNEAGNVAPIGRDSSFFLVISPPLPSFSVTIVPEKIAP